MFCTNTFTKNPTKSWATLVFASFLLGPVSLTASAQIVCAAEELAFSQDFCFKPLTGLAYNLQGETLPAWYIYGPKRPVKRYLLLPPSASKRQWCFVLPDAMRDHLKIS